MFAQFIEYLNQNFITVFLLVGFSMKLAMRKHTRDAQMRYMWLTVICTAVLTVEDFLEAIAAQDPRLLFWRTLLSVIGYVLRPLAALSVALVVVPPRRTQKYLWVPVILNLAVVSTAFFSPIAFSFGENYTFIRGPLGYVPFVVSYFYIVAALWQTRKKYREGRVWEVRVLYVCATACIIASILDSLFGGTHVTQAIMVSCIFYYMFIRSQDTNRDSLTKLFNRQSFYEDTERLSALVTAVASVDMNGLKPLNDSRGHDAGDEALRTIGQCMLDASSRTIIPYRMGGDEFLILFLKEKEETVVRTLQAIKASVEERHYSLALGYAVRTDAQQDLTELCKQSDQIMYADKATYYAQPTRNRRRRDDPPAAE